VSAIGAAAPEEAVPALLWLDGAAGLRSHPVEVVGRTPARYRVRLPSTTRLAGRNRWGEAGQVVLVPRGAIELRPDDDLLRRRIAMAKDEAARRGAGASR
jgi:hypothetical protein